ncbi:M23 family metallopeptidase [Acidimicrobiia bacterium EGI L10123]|uniref:M23 family metallopeptidase n=1 Tax=Salinilacustrithrix flava TaxID=2957203 RepID=UPI003D7C1E23|nr:M23 family metallopeptidase [Acidimicrobiia bacterium EGI L10123]
MGAHRRLDRILALAVVLVVLAAGAAPAYAQLIGDDPFREPEPAPTTTTTTAPPDTTPTTSAPQPSEPSQPPSSEPPPSEPAPSDPPAGGEAPPPDGGDSTSPPPSSTARGIPPEAQAIMDSIERSPANSSQALHDAVLGQLVPLGLSPQEAIRVGFGRFPIAGVANFTHDWYFPRWGPGFRFHKGTDVFADHGTPVRSPVDGTVTSGNGSLGGIFVKVFQPDGTYFYMAHLAGLVEGFQEGMAVKTGDIVGYVGNTGNARTTPPHVHLGVYSPGGEPTDPKPILDQMLADALAALPGIVEQVKAQQPAAPAAAPSAAPAARVPRSLLASSLLRSLVDERAAGSLDTAVLLEAVGNPSSAGLAVAEAEASALAASIDWDARAARTRTERELVERVGQMFRSALGPLD